MNTFHISARGTKGNNWSGPATQAETPPGAGENVYITGRHLIDTRKGGLPRLIKGMGLIYVILTIRLRCREFIRSRDWI